MGMAAIWQGKLVTNDDEEEELAGTSAYQLHMRTFLR